MSHNTEYNALELAAIHSALQNYLDHLQSGKFNIEDSMTKGEIEISKSALKKTEKQFRQKTANSDLSL